MFFPFHVHVHVHVPDSTFEDFPLPSGHAWRSGYQFAYLTDSTLYLLGVDAKQKDKIVNDLWVGAHPDGVFTRGTVIPLAKVIELRYSEKAGVLEVHYGAKRPATVNGEHIGRLIYAALGASLATAAWPTSGKLSARNSITSPLWGLVFTLFMGGLFIAIAIGADPVALNQRMIAPGVRPWFEQFQDAFCYLIAQIGVHRIIGIVVALAAIFGGWLAYRMMRPLPAEVIVIKRGSSGAGPARGGG
jgi:hypothetical protein